MKPRKYPRAQVGDTFGVCTVEKLLATDHTSNERVLLRCVCGHLRAAYVYNVRAHPPRCIRHSPDAIEASQHQRFLPRRGPPNPSGEHRGKVDFVRDAAGNLVRVTRAG